MTDFLVWNDQMKAELLNAATVGNAEKVKTILKQFPNKINEGLNVVRIN
jgi:hypothetical protein